MNYSSFCVLSRNIRTVSVAIQQKTGKINVIIIVIECFIIRLVIFIIKSTSVTTFVTVSIVTKSKKLIIIPSKRSQIGLYLFDLDVQIEITINLSLKFATKYESMSSFIFIHMYSIYRNHKQSVKKCLIY